jgi:hypothetical protein
LVNSSAPNNSVNIVSSLSNGFLTVPAADFNSSGGLSNLRAAYVVYIKDGKLFKVNISGESQSTTAIQLSNETQAATSCSFNGVQVPQVLTSYPDYVADASIIFYKAVSGNTCVDKAVQVGMNSTANPITLGGREILAPYLNITNGRIAGFLVRDGLSLGVVDPQLANFSLIANFNSDVQISNGSAKSILVTIDGGLRRFDFGTKQLSSTIITYPENTFILGAADSNAYFWSGPEIGPQGGATGKISLYKLTDTTNPTLTKMYTSNQAIFQLLDVTTSNIVVKDSTGYGTVSKTGNSFTALNIPNTALTLGANGERVFYWVRTFPNQSQSIFGSILSNNTGLVELIDSHMAAIEDSAISLYDFAEIDSYIILEYANDRTTMAKSTLSVVSGVTGQKTTLLGTLPDVAYDFTEADNFRYGVIGFCKSSTQLCDAYYHNKNTNSLIRVTQLVQ